MVVAVAVAVLAIPAGSAPAPMVNVYGAFPVAEHVVV
jgi:hypothetical protein